MESTPKRDRWEVWSTRTRTVAALQRGCDSLAQQFGHINPEVETEARSFCIHDRDSGAVVTVFRDFKDIVDYEVSCLVHSALPIAQCALLIRAARPLENNK